MAILNCSALECQSNCGGKCTLGSIMIKGDDAKCGSYSPGVKSPVNSVCGSGRNTVNIRCGADECMFNCNSVCSADSVQICGPDSCSGCTQCATFKERF